MNLVIEFGDFDPDRQTAKLKMTPVFPDIHYKYLAISVRLVQCYFYNPTLCGQQYCVRLQRLSDYGVSLGML